MTSLRGSGIDEVDIDRLTRLGFDSVEQFLAAAEVAGPELSACMTQPLQRIVAQASRRATQMSQQTQQQLASLPCPLGAKFGTPNPIQTIPPNIAGLVPSQTISTSLIPKLPPSRMGFRGVTPHALALRLLRLLRLGGTRQGRET